MKAVAVIVGILALIIVGSVAIAITDDVANVDQWSYGEYRTVTDAVSASGSVELVGDTIHATSVGQGVITLSDGKTIDVDVKKAVLDVLFITGQSNATYITSTAVNDEAAPVPPPGTAYVWATDSGQYSHFYTEGSQPSFMPMTSPDGESLTGGLAPSFAATYYQDTGRFSYWICGAWGGKSIDHFDPRDGDVWIYMKDVLSEAVSAVDKSKFELRFGPYVFIQGEFNASTNIDAYKREFMRMHNAILDGDLGEDFNRCVISLPRAEDATNAVIAQKELAEAHPSTITIATDAADGFTVDNGLMASDDLHYTQAGMNIIGAALGLACAELSGGADTGSARSLMPVIPVIMGIVVGIMAISLALRAIMGRD